MNPTVEHFRAASQAELKELEGRTQQAWAAFEKLIKLNMATYRIFLGESAGWGRALVNVKDAGEMPALYQGLLQALAVKSAVYNKQLFSLASHTGEVLAKDIEIELAQARTVVADAMDKVIQNAPLGTERTFSDFSHDVKALRGLME